MYLGTKIGFYSTSIPKGFKVDKFEEFTDYKETEKKVVHLKRVDVVNSNPSKTLFNIIEKLNDEFKTDKNNAYGIIKFIESNIKGNSLLSDLEPNLVVTVIIYSKKVRKPKKVTENKD